MGHSYRSRRRAAASASVTFVAIVALVTACGGSGSPQTDPTDAPTPPSASPTPTDRVGTVENEAGGTINYACYGEGSPVILLEAGSASAGTEQYSSALIDPMAERTTVCTYDRLGTGQSVDPPDHRRTMDDLCAVQDQVIDALAIPTPYVLVGQSAGGNMVIGCADRHPDRLAALVVIEGYHDDPRQMRKWQRREGFTWRDDPEHLDYIAMSSELDGLDMPVGRFPVLILAATESGPRGIQNQKYWLGLSPDAHQVVVEGGHDLHDENPQAVVKEVLALLEG